MNPPSRAALVATLAVAVPLRIHELQQKTEAIRDGMVRAWAANAVDEVASKGDVLQYGGRKGEAAQVFNHLARGLAALAHCPGGVSFAGMHWCLDHRACTGESEPSRPTFGEQLALFYLAAERVARPVETVTAGAYL